MAERKSLALLAAILNELEIELSTKSMNSRIAMQKALYLAQVAGVDMGYRFGWYVRGPYCADLADDYYEAAASEEYKNFEAGETLRELLTKVKRILEQRPTGVEQSDWLEAVASLDYIRRVQKVREGVEGAFRREKPHLARLYAQADGALRPLVVGA